MTAFKQFVSELASKEVVLPPEEVAEMTRRFGDRTLLMGHLREDGSLVISADCILEAARSLGDQRFAEAAEAISNEKMGPFLRSAEAFVEQVCQARECKLRQMIRAFQNEPEADKSHQRWQQIESEIFGVDYND